MPEQNTSNQISIEVDANPMKPVRNRWDIKTPEISTEVAIFEASTTVSLYMQEFPDSIGNGLFCKSVEINDLKHRFALMNKANQDQVNKDTGAFMSVRGRYYPDKALATPLEPPLTMDIKATSQDQLNLAMKHVQNIIDDAQKSAFAVKGFDVRVSYF